MEPDGNRSHELTRAEIEELLRAAALAPSSHNTQPWTLHWTGAALEVRGNPERALPHADPDDRELRLACGAALANIRLTMRAQGRRAHTELLPDSADPWLIGRVRPGAASPPLPWEQLLAEVVQSRRTDRGAFGPGPLSVRQQHDLVTAAQREHSHLVVVDDPADLARLREITATAHREQRADPAFVAEWEHWVGNPARTEDGIPASLARRAPLPDQKWRPRDFAGGTALAGDGTRPGPDHEDTATLVVVATPHDLPISHVQAGQALEHVLLTAAARGLGASLVAPPLERPDRRREVRELLGGTGWPQAILRVGHGGLPRGTPRRRLATT